MKKPYILVVDDDPNVGFMISEHLEKLGYRVTHCTDAVQAVLQAEGLKIGLLIVDMMMPYFGSGLDAYKNIRNNIYLPKDLPIIFLTAMQPEKARQLVPLQDPRVRLLYKPIPFAELTKTIEELSG